MVIIVACSPTAPPQPTDWSQQSSASSGGGLQSLIKAARREGQLNLAVTPADSAGWIANVQGFQQRYGIQLNLLTTLASDSDQVGAVMRLRGSSDAPDVLDLSPGVAEANTSLLAPYLVFYWLEIPGTLKNPKAYWYDDCGGYLSIGFDPSRVAAAGSIQALLGDQYRGGVSLAGDPATDEGALGAVIMASIASGGTPDDVGPGVDFFRHLKDAGNLTSWGPNGIPPVVLDWEFKQPNRLAGWKFLVPPEASVAAYRAQAVSRFAPHPAAARLWEEYLMSDTGQNACLRLGALPSRMAAMQSEGTLDLAAASALAPVGTKQYVLTAAELAAAQSYVAAHWQEAVG